MSELFDLDALEREDGVEPFVAQINGKPITMADPKDIDWQDLVTVNTDDAVQLFEAAITNEDELEHFYASSVPAWKLDKLVEAYLTHYGMPLPPKFGSSRGSSRGMERRQKRTSR